MQDNYCSNQFFFRNWKIYTDLFYQDGGQHVEILHRMYLSSGFRYEDK